MGWNGSGTFTRVHDWTDDAVNGIKVSASRMDADIDDIVQQGLMNCLTKDGQTSPTANIDMGAHKITNLGAGEDATDVPTYDQATKTPVALLSAGANTLDATHLNKVVIAPSGVAVTTIALPAVSTARNGATIKIVNLNTTSVTVNRFGTDVINSSGGSGYTSVTVSAGQTLTITSSGTAWYTSDGSAMLSMPATFGPFAASMASNGYLKIDGVGILQWTTATITSGSAYGTISFPIAFPNTALAVIPVSKTTATAKTLSLGSMGASSCTIYHSPSTTDTSVQVFAIGS